MDRCYFCRGRVTARKVDHLHRWGEAMLLVKGLPAGRWSRDRAAPLLQDPAPGLASGPESDYNLGI